MEMQKRPKLYIPRSKIENILDVMCMFFIIGNIIYISMKYPFLSDKIPIHFNGNNIADGWGYKGLVWILPFITLIVWMAMTILEKFPHLFNYTNLTKKNIASQYKNGRLMVNLIKSEITIFLVYNSWNWINAILGNKIGLGVWEMLIFLIIIIGTIVMMAVRSMRIE